MKDLIRYLLILSFLLISSCQKDTTISEKSHEDVEFRYFNLEKAGWKSKVRQQSVENIKFSAVDVPIQYYLLKEIGNSDLIQIDSLYEENKTNRIIEFEFQDTLDQDLLQEKFTNLDYERSVAYMSFDIEKDFYAVAGKDTIECTQVIFERNFKVGPSNKLILFFANVNPEENIQLIYNDNLFKKGILKFNFSDHIIKL